jgi:hypothetical protein
MAIFYADTGSFNQLTVINLTASTSSILYISSSTLNVDTNLITVNANNPSVRYGGLAVIDSGSSPQRSGSILFDSTNNQWIFVHQNTGGAVTSSVFIQGPQTFNNVGNETTLTTNKIPKATGGDLGEHIGDSNITDTGTTIQLGANTQITGSLIVTSSMVIGSTSLGPNENTLTLGARDNVQEGGQLGFNAAGDSYTSASFIDLYQNRLRILKGTNATSTGEVANWNMHNLQMSLPAYNSATAFTGSTIAGLGIDSGGNVTTTRISTTPQSLALASLGSAIKVEPLWGGWQNYPGSSYPLINQRCILQPVYIYTQTTITGVKWVQITSGSYTGNNYNGVGLYSYDGAGNLNCVASSSNNANFWSSFLNNTMGSASFSFGSNYNAAPGLYYIAAVWNQTGAVTTNPAIGQGLTSTTTTFTFDFTNSAKGTSRTNAAVTTALPTSVAMSNITALQNVFYLTLY